LNGTRMGNRHGKTHEPRGSVRAGTKRLGPSLALAR
jgi:hypothetical protein